MIDSEQLFFLSEIGRKASAISYRNGRNNSRLQLPEKYLGARNSAYIDISSGNPAYTIYGRDKDDNPLGHDSSLEPTVTRSEYLNYLCSMRSWDNWNSFGKTKEESNAFAVETLNLCKANGGLFHDFVHWHSAYNNGSIESIDDFLALIRSTIGSDFVWTSSFGEAMEYMWARELARRVHVIEKNGKVLVSVDFHDRYPSGEKIDFSLLNTPLSVRVDLTGTSLSGKNIKASFSKPLQESTNIFIIEVPLHQMKIDAISTIELSEDTTGNYYNKNIPSISYSGGSVISNQLVTVTVFQISMGSASQEVANPYLRNFDYKSSHLLALPSGVYSICIKNDFGMSNYLRVII